VPKGAENISQVAKKKELLLKKRRQTKKIN
jgi:hypothetical protein